MRLLVEEVGSVLTAERRRERRGGEGGLGATHVPFGTLTFGQVSPRSPSGLRLVLLQLKARHTWNHPGSPEIPLSP